jgi:hypothetical protein
MILGCDRRGVGVGRGWFGEAGEDGGAAGPDEPAEEDDVDGEPDEADPPRRDVGLGRLLGG